MYFAYAIAGLIAGAIIADASEYWLLGALVGAAIGVLLARIVELERRVRRLESSTRRDSVSAWDKPASAQIPTAQEEQQPENTAPWAGPDRPVETVARAAKPLAQPPVTQGLERASAMSSPGPSLLQIFLDKSSTWFTTGNVPVKVGVIVSFIGISFLLKYAIDRELVIISLEVRLLAVAVAGIALLAIGWHLRRKDRVYALSLQGGGVGILFLTTFAALQLWQLLPAGLAFVLLVALTILTGVLAVMQNSRSLAILGVIGGFLAPLLASTGQGNHVILFGYYLVLNCAILGIAWFRAWQGLNLIGWLFTFLIGSTWGYQYYKPELLASTQPFLIAHFLLYQAVAILFALRQPPRRLGIVDGTLVFGTPIIVFALQAALVEGIEDALAIAAVIVAVFYALTAAWLWQSKGRPLRLLTESFMALAVVFATIAIPLLFDARWTAAAWAAEGAALVWVGTRQGRQLAKLAGTMLVFLGGLAFIESGWQRGAGYPVLNGNVLGGLLISLSAFFTSRKLETFDDQQLIATQKLASVALFTWGVLWWLGTGWMEISERMGFIDQAGHHYRAPAFLLFVSLSSGLAAWLGRARQWSKARRSSMLLLPFLILLAWAYMWDHEHFLVGPGWLAWPLAWVIQAFVLKVMDEQDDRGVAAWHFWSLLLLTSGLAIEAAWWVNRIASDDWAGAVAATVMGIMAMLVWQFKRRSAWPMLKHPFTYYVGGLLLVAGQVLLLTGLAINMSGDPAPWPYIPVLNPFDLAMLFAMLTTMKALAEMGTVSAIDTVGMPSWSQPFRLMLAAAFFVLTTMALVRGVHHFTAVVWEIDALFDSITVQTSLSIYWGLLGFTGMVWGARSSRRAIWLTGAGFMALVVLKLFMVDLGNTGTVARIISFIGIGVLLLVVGYFAPAPPKATDM